MVNRCVNAGTLILCVTVDKSDLWVNFKRVTCMCVHVACAFVCGCVWCVSLSVCICICDACVCVACVQQLIFPCEHELPPT